jgi:hypothetical protein
MSRAENATSDKNVAVRSDRHGNVAVKRYSRGAPDQLGLIRTAHTDRFVENAMAATFMLMRRDCAARSIQEKV